MTDDRWALVDEYTIEVNDQAAAVARTNFAGAGCGELIDLRLGSALDVLPRLQAEGAGPFDFIFIDADKKGYDGFAVVMVTGT